jgi:phosphatidate cytidylyltransferase
MKKYNIYNSIVLIISTLFFIFSYFFDLKNSLILTLTLILFILFAYEIILGTPNLSMSRIAIAFIGAFFIPMALMHMVYIRNSHNGLEITLLIFVVTWISDTTSYIIGSNFGKYKLAKNISPNKTIEGCISGIAVGVITTIVLHYFFKNTFPTWKYIILGFIITIIGQFSDISESLIKRDGQVKDSSKIIPGHGGLLDRFDSYIFLAPALYYINQLFL